MYLHCAVIMAMTCLASAPSRCEGARLEVGDPMWSAYPPSAGDSVWFDVFVVDPMGESAQNIQLTLSMQPIGAASLIFDATASQAVDSDPSYWVLGNSVGAGALSLGGDKYQFGDSPDNGLAELLGQDDIVARFAFTWNGNAGDYLASVDTGLTNTYIMDESFDLAAPEWVASELTLHVPEPATVMLMALGGCTLVRRRFAD